MEKLLNEIAAQEEKIRIKNLCGNSLARGVPKKNIEWETDIEKVDFAQLRNGGEFDKAYIFVRNETVKLESEGKTFEELINTGDHSYFNLFMLIERGMKIIPPFYVEEEFWIDGELRKKPIYRGDGSHRERLASAYGFEEIPIFVFKENHGIRHYLFTPDKWQFENRDGRLLAKDGKKEILLPQGRAYVKNDNFELVEIEVFNQSFFQ